MYCVFCYSDEKWVKGIRNNAIVYSNNKFDALKFPDLITATYFVIVLERFYPDVYFRVFPFNE